MEIQVNNDSVLTSENTDGERIETIYLDYADIGLCLHLYRNGKFVNMSLLLKTHLDELNKMGYITINKDKFANNG